MLRGEVIDFPRGDNIEEGAEGLWVEEEVEEGETDDDGRAVQEEGGVNIYISRENYYDYENMFVE